MFTGDNVMMGYATTPDDLAADAGPRDLRTGDLARLGSDGFYRWVGRRNRVAKAFGLRIDLDHLDEALADDGISAASVETDAGIAVFATSDDDLIGAVARASGLPRHAIQASDRARAPDDAERQD